MYPGSLFIALGFTLFVFLIAFLEIIDLYLIFKRRKKEKKVILSNAEKLLNITAILGLICILYGYFIEPYWIDTHFVTIPTDKLHNTSLRIVQISDLHCDEKIRNEDKLSKLINKLNPDIVVFTGDAVNSQDAVPNFKNTLAQIEAKYGKFAISGNWDLYPLLLYTHTDFQLLEANTVNVTKNNETIFITGVSFYAPSQSFSLLKKIPKSSFSVFLFHSPDLIEQIASLPVDLYLAGHTHGGQVALPFYGAIITMSVFGKKYEAGQFKINNTILYVNRGIGMEGGSLPKVRFMSRPEITVFDIVPAT